MTRICYSEIPRLKGRIHLLPASLQLMNTRMTSAKNKLVLIKIILLCYSSKVGPKGGPGPKWFRDAYDDWTLPQVHRQRGKK